MLKTLYIKDGEFTEELIKEIMSKKNWTLERPVYEKPYFSWEHPEYKEYEMANYSIVTYEE